MEILPENHSDTTMEIFPESLEKQLNIDSSRGYSCKFLDNFSYYYIDENNDIKVRMFIPPKYRKEDLINFYKTERQLRLDNDKYIIDDDNELIFIPLVNKYRNIIDYCFTELKNYDIVIKYRFFLRIATGGKKYVSVSCTDKDMHHIIFGRKAGRGHRIDHKNSNGLDNRSCNIRELTFSGNAANRKKIKGTSSRYIGVSHSTADRTKWRSYITFKGKRYDFGKYDNVIDAVKIRDVYSLYLTK